MGDPTMSDPILVPIKWSSDRRSASRPGGSSDVRTPFEQDYDRLLFSTPVRRLADKTQVFPLERNDSVRTRLTHSLEVSNISKSVGIRLVRKDPAIFGVAGLEDVVPVVLATAGLAHDLGNPPFGHQGEVAIRRWFAEHRDIFVEAGNTYGDSPGDAFEAVPVHHQSDFLQFDGNPQALRLVSQLQNTSGSSGLNLTATSIASLMKYPISSDGISNQNAITKKHGFFASERPLVEWVWAATGLSEGRRHPLTWIMEAADDIAYSVLDIEDSIKKNLVAAEDLLAYLRGRFSLTDLGGLANQLEEDFKKADSNEFSLSRVREIKATYLRTRLIERLITGATNQYLQYKVSIALGDRKRPLLECDSEESKLCAALKKFANVHAYQSPSVLSLEMKGASVITTLMDAMWEAIVSRKQFTEPGSRRTTPRSAFVYSLISDSYRWCFERRTDMSMRYREMQLLTDMVSGMTDGYAIDLFEQLKPC